MTRSCRAVSARFRTSPAKRRRSSSGSPLVFQPFVIGVAVEHGHEVEQLAAAEAGTGTRWFFGPAQRIIAFFRKRSGTSSIGNTARYAIWPDTRGLPSPDQVLADFRPDAVCADQRRPGMTPLRRDDANLVPRSRRSARAFRLGRVRHSRFPDRHPAARRAGRRDARGRRGS